MKTKPLGPPVAARKLFPKEVLAELALRDIRAIKHFAKLFELDPKTMGNN